MSKYDWNFAWTESDDNCLDYRHVGNFKATEVWVNMVQIWLYFPIFSPGVLFLHASFYFFYFFEKMYGYTAYQNYRYGFWPCIIKQFFIFTILYLLIFLITTIYYGNEVREVSEETGI